MMLVAVIGSCFETLHVIRHNVYDDTTDLDSLIP